MWNRIWAFKALRPKNNFVKEMRSILLSLLLLFESKDSGKTKLWWFGLNWVSESGTISVGFSRGSVGFVGVLKFGVVPGRT